MKEIIPAERIFKKIYLIRQRKVILDRDLAALYGVETRILKQAVRRNIERFPDDFMFELTKEEFTNWRSQIVISNKDKMGLRYNPMVFTEQGVAMLSSVLNSNKAIQVNIQIMRAFIEIRKTMLSVDTLHKEIELLKVKFNTHDYKLNILFKAIEELLKPSIEPMKGIGFRDKDED